MSTDNDKKRILVLTSTFPRWNNDTEPSFVYELCRRLSHAGYEIDVLAPHTQGAKTTETFGALTVYRYRYFLEYHEKLAYQGGIMANLKANKFCYLLIPFFLLSQSIQTYKLLKQKKYSLVHAHWIIPQGFIAALISKLAGDSSPPIIVTSHGSDFFAFNIWPLSIIKNWTMISLKKLVVVSQFLRSCYQQHLNSHCDIEVCAMGVDLTDKFVPIDVDIEKNNRLIFVGRLVEKKGLKFLLKALRLILDKNIDVHLDVVGDGPEKKNIETLIKSLKLENYVILHGARKNDDLPQFYQRASIAVVPSIIGENNSQEGLGLTTIEAMGCECAVVASSLQAISEVIDDGESGMLCEPSNAQILADKIETLLDDPSLRRKIATAGRKQVLAKFDWQQITEKYAQIYESAIKSIN